MTKEFLRNTLLNFICLPILIATPVILTACGGGGGSSDESASSVTADSGSSTIFQAVDPYISGAVFQEIANDGQTLLQRSSTATDDQGHFSFPREVSPGSVVELKPGSKGMHLGTTYQGMLRFRIPEDGAGGGTTRISSYDSSTRRCNGCHGSATW